MNSIFLEPEHINCGFVRGCESSRVGRKEKNAAKGFSRPMGSGGN